ncbi:MAG: hypothetical protein QOE41_2865 [Mycobacterium sp.]|jgi:hypothetical protein|nr:hypothetical protein [Mycobacterium sp.]MDT5133554.1 hypothetical protein [Mycobacterium sp.]
MLIGALILAVIAVVALVAAVVTGSTVVGLIVIVLAALGLLLLAVDSLRQRQPRDSGPATTPDTRPGQADDKRLKPDMFEPDVLYEDGVQDAPETEQHGAPSSTT